MAKTLQTRVHVVTQKPDLGTVAMDIYSVRGPVVTLWNFGFVQVNTETGTIKAKSGSIGRLGHGLTMSPDDMAALKAYAARGWVGLVYGNFTDPETGEGFFVVHAKNGASPFVPVRKAIDGLVKSIGGVHAKWWLDGPSQDKDGNLTDLLTLTMCRVFTFENGTLVPQEKT